MAVVSLATEFAWPLSALVLPYHRAQVFWESDRFLTKRE